MEMVEAWVAFFCLAMAFRAIEILSNHKHLASSHTSPNYQYGKSKRGIYDSLYTNGLRY